MMRRSFPVLLLCALAVLGSSCNLLAPQPDQTRFAVLASADELSSVPRNSVKADAALQLGLGPISVPDYLRRTAIVTREGGTRLVPSPTESWAEPFESALARVLELNLRRETAVGSVILHPWYETERPQVQVEIAFSRCERDATLGVVVEAHWRIRRIDGGKSAEHETRLEIPCASADGNEVARAISEALAELCRQIGAAL